MTGTGAASAFGPSIATAAETAMAIETTTTAARREMPGPPRLVTALPSRAGAAHHVVDHDALARDRTFVLRLAQGEHATVRAEEPVPVAVGGGSHAHHRPVQVLAALRAEEGSIAEGEDAAVGGHEPVAAAAGRGRHAHHRLVQVHVPLGPVV